MITQLLTAPATAVYALAKATGAAVEAHQERQARQMPTPVPDPALGPPRVSVYGFCHQDVVRDVYTGWTGTVLHSRKIGSSTDLARVRWSSSLASTPLVDVAPRLALLQRRA